MIYRTAPYSAALNDPYPDFKVTPLFDAEGLSLSEMIRDTDIVSMEY